MKCIKNVSDGTSRKLGNVFRFIDNLIAVNDENELENLYNEIYLLELLFRKENISISNIPRY